MPQKVDNQSYFNQHKIVVWDNPPIVVAWKFSSADNLGALLRVCDNFGVKEVFFVGNEVDYKLSRIKRNSTTSFNKVKWNFVSDIQIWENLPKEALKIGVDTTTESVALNDVNFKSMKQNSCLFFGNETIGLENEVLAKCDGSVHIPMIGESFSMNVVQSAAVVLFEVARQTILNN